MNKLIPLFLLFGLLLSCDETMEELASAQVSFNSINVDIDYEAFCSNTKDSTDYKITGVLNIFSNGVLRTVNFATENASQNSEMAVINCPAFSAKWKQEGNVIAQDSSNCKLSRSQTTDETKRNHIIKLSTNLNPSNVIYPARVSNSFDVSSFSYTPVGFEAVIQCSISGSAAAATFIFEGERFKVDLDKNNQGSQSSGAQAQGL